MKFTVNMTLIVDEEENILPFNYDNKEGDEQSLKDILTDYFFDIDGIFFTASNKNVFSCVSLI